MERAPTATRSDAIRDKVQAPRSARLNSPRRNTRSASASNTARYVWFQFKELSRTESLRWPPILLVAMLCCATTEASATAAPALPSRPDAKPEAAAASAWLDAVRVKDAGKV